jgi:hypothetical protein
MIFDFGLPEDIKKNSEFYNLFQVWDKQIRANVDNRMKSIGDRVVIWHSGGSCDMKGNFYYEGEDFFKQEMIVIDTDIKYVANLTHLGQDYGLPLDLILYSPSSEKTVRSNSDFCRIIDKRK